MNFEIQPYLFSLIWRVSCLHILVFFKIERSPRFCDEKPLNNAFRIDKCAMINNKFLDAIG